jgi:hypothetical protein
VVEFDPFKSSFAFFMMPGQWMEKTSIIDLFSKAGRYPSTEQPAQKPGDLVTEKS